MEKPSYYAILTADVRYDENLNANEKLLFAEITALTNATGQCWASNNYFARLFNVTPQAVSKWINKLKKLGYIEVEMKYDENNPKVISRRYIRIVGNKSENVSTEDEGVSTDVSDVSTEDCEGINQDLGGYQRRIKENNTSNNNTSNNNISNNIYIGEVPEELHNVPTQQTDNEQESSGIPYNEIVDYLNQKTNKHFRPNISKTRTAIKSRWKEGFRESDFKYVIDVKCSQWLNDSQMSKYLRPETLFGNKFESYLNEEISSSSGDIWDRMLRGEV
jgi:uncharacterized phage protein (TIGR02220 family)